MEGDSVLLPYQEQCIHNWTQRVGRVLRTSDPLTPPTLYVLNSPPGTGKSAVLVQMLEDWLADNALSEAATTPAASSDEDSDSDEEISDVD
jgi:hypothetical protein